MICRADDDTYLDYNETPEGTNDIHTHLTLTNAILMLEFIVKPNGLYPICLIHGGISTS